jgi:hypothetical protein
VKGDLIVWGALGGSRWGVTLGCVVCVYVCALFPCCLINTVYTRQLRGAPGHFVPTGVFS